MTNRPRADRLADQFPALYPFGIDLPVFLDATEERSAPFERRLESVWRYVARRVKRFAATLGPRESAVLDVEDVVQAVVEQLTEKDHLWDPGRGRYLTFVEAAMKSILAGCHERARTVTGPSNSYARMKGYREREELGTLTRPMRETMERLRIVMGDFEQLGGDEVAVVEVEDDVDVRSLVCAIKKLDNPIHAWVIVRRHGLFGVVEMSFAEIAERLEMDEKAARRIARIARARLKKIVRSEHGSKEND